MPTVSPHVRIVKTTLESLIFILRGTDGMDLPRPVQDRLELIAREAVARLDRGNYPALTASELQTISLLVTPGRRINAMAFFRRRA